MKNLIKTLILILSTSAIGFSQTPISFSQTKDTVYVNSIFDPYYNSPNDTVNIGDTITLINEVASEILFVTDTNTLYDGFFPTNNNQIICKYIINKNSQSILISDTVPPGNPLNEIATINFHVQNSTTGINEVDYQNGFKVFPNPSNDVLNIQSGSVINKIDIENLVGQRIYSSLYNEKNVILDISNFASGVYFIRINNNFVRKIVKE